ncbi:TetR/AcrR family transcriptional regulator [Aquimarina pacifica]|uniref:TetR/AcrR family transcriptional regulator n=1 Tax=Aquimarina pacifica TaxID=1296415 RepID=UPI00046E8169|nr:TetR/AcrR family transcriptional regulator [Aquimarina pacifica]
MKHSLIKQHIIETASTLFYKNGYNLTGINEIIKESGIAKATLYNHFSSKEDICLAYLQFKNNGFKKDIKSFIDNSKKGKNQLYALFNFLLEFYDHKDFNGCWCLNTFAEIPKDNQRIRKEIQKQKEDFIRFIQELIIENYNQGTIAKNEMLAKQIYLIYESAISESKVHQNQWPIKAGLHLCKTIVN